MPFADHVERQLAELRAAGLYRRARDIDGPQGPRFVVDGKPALCLCSNNYLGFAGDTRLVEIAHQALVGEGFGSGASRLISGSMAAHRAAERALAGFCATPDSVLFSTGYAANLGALQALAGRGDVIFSDALNHASLIDGARLSRAQVVVYEHADPEDLERKLKAARGRGKAAFVVSETLFSMDGDIPPLKALSELARSFDAAFIVDEAHALGVFGPEGRGLCRAEGIVPDLLIGTLGKAFGAQGAFVAASSAAVDLIRNRARSYVFSTAMAAPAARVAEHAIELVLAADDRRSRVLAHARRLRSALSELGYRVLPGASPIVPVMVGDPEPTMQLSARLLERGVFAHGIRPPTVPAGTGRLRVVPMATHTEADLDEAIDAFRAVRP